MLTKKYSHNLKVEGYFIWWQCLGLWAPSDRQHLSSSEKTAPRSQEWVRLYTSLQQRSRQSEHQRTGIKLRNLCIGYTFYAWKMQASGLTEFIPFICSSVIWGQSCFLVHLQEWQMAASCLPPAPEQSPWGVEACIGSQFWEPSFTFGGQKLLMAVTFLVY